MKYKFQPQQIEATRKNLGYTVHDMLRVWHDKGFGVSPQTYYNWLKGDSTPTAQQLANICMWAGKSVSYFFDRENNKTSCVSSKA